jgi:hypothetical protein
MELTHSLCTSRRSSGWSACWQTKLQRRAHSGPPWPAVARVCGVWGPTHARSSSGVTPSPCRDPQPLSCPGWAQDVLPSRMNSHRATSARSPTAIKKAPGILLYPSQQRQTGSGASAPGRLLLWCIGPWAPRHSPRPRGENLAI